MDINVWISLGVCIATIICNIVVSAIQSKKQSALVQYRLEELEKKQDKHNNLIERVYIVEKDIAVIKEELKNKDE